MLVTQETSLAPDLSVLENIFMAEMGRRGRAGGNRRRRGTAILEALGMGGVFTLDAKVETLSIAQRQLVEIAKALALDARVVIFDEPTSSLSRRALLRDRLRLASAGGGFRHYRPRHGDARGGADVANSVPTASLNQAELIRIMVGQELASVYHTRRPARPSRRRAGGRRAIGTTTGA